MQSPAVVIDKVMSYELLYKGQIRDHKTLKTGSTDQSDSKTLRRYNQHNLNKLNFSTKQLGQ